MTPYSDKDMQDLFDEISSLHKQNKELIVKNMDLTEQLNLNLVGKPLKKSIQEDFERWYLSEGYIETEKIGVYKNGCNIILHKHLFYKYVNDVKF